MTITSLPFLGFCIASFCLFLLFPKKYRWIALLIASVAFYSIATVKLIPFIIVTTFSIWAIARKIDSLFQIEKEECNNPDLDKSQKKAIKAKYAGKRKYWLIFALVLNIGILISSKVFTYYADAFTALVGFFMGTQRADAVKFITPLGISYYTFSTVGYILDVYWKRYESEKNPFRFFLYSCYFPHIMQGPISRYSKLGQELKKPELRLTWANFVRGMESVLLGCFKKLVIADRASIFVSDALYQSGLTGKVYILAMILDAVQIYADFSGYMDIVSGVSIMFDVELEKNFNHPFLAKSVPEFWRRWHMSLGSWFKDYVYYPMTISKWNKKLNKSIKNMRFAHIKTFIGIIIPVSVTWLLTGLWHGTGLGYVCWGIYYGMLIAFSVTFYDDFQLLWKRLNINTECFSWQVLRLIKIFCIFMGGRFLANQLGFAHRKEIIKSILVNFGFASTIEGYFSNVNFLILFIGIVVLIAIAAIESSGRDIFEWFNSQNKWFCAIIIYSMFFAVLLYGIYGSGYDTSTFMYQQF